MTDTSLIRRCTAVQGSCECGLWEDHDGAHECDNRDGVRCNGSWVTDDRGDLVEVVRWPGWGW